MKKIFSIVICFALFGSLQASDLSAVITNTMGSASSGEIDLSITGGVPSYTISWTGPGGFISSAEDLSGLAYGVYEVTVTDLYCGEATMSFLVDSTGPSAIAVLDKGGFSVEPNPISERFRLKFDKPIAEGRVLLYGQLGQLVFSAAILNEGGVTEIALPKTVSRGVYTLKVEDAAGVHLGVRKVLVL